MQSSVPVEPLITTTRPARQRDLTRMWLALGSGFLIWLIPFAIAILPVMLAPPISMTLPDYLMDVAVTCLIYPVLTIGVGVVLAARRPL